MNILTLKIARPCSLWDTVPVMKRNDLLPGLLPLLLTEEGRLR